MQIDCCYIVQIVDCGCCIGLLRHANVRGGSQASSGRSQGTLQIAGSQFIKYLWFITKTGMRQEICFGDGYVRRYYGYDLRYGPA